MTQIQDLKLYPKRARNCTSKGTLTACMIVALTLIAACRPNSEPGDILTSTMPVSTSVLVQKPPLTFWIQAEGAALETPAVTFAIQGALLAPEDSYVFYSMSPPFSEVYTDLEQVQIGDDRGGRAAAEQISLFREKELELGLLYFSFRLDSQAASRLALQLGDPAGERLGSVPLARLLHPELEHNDLAGKSSWLSREGAFEQAGYQVSFLGWNILSWEEGEETLSAEPTTSDQLITPQPIPYLPPDERTLAYQATLAARPTPQLRPAAALPQFEPFIPLESWNFVEHQASLQVEELALRQTVEVVVQFLHDQGLLISAAGEVSAVNSSGLKQSATPYP